MIGFFSAAPASAHTKLIDTTPAAGKELGTAPGAVGLTFSGKVLKLGAVAKVSGPGGATSVGAAKLAGRTISWPLSGDLANGTYTVSWRVTSGDGHPVAGRFSFVLRAAVQPTGSPSSVAVDPATGASALPTPAPTRHTVEPQMTGPMPGMEGMPQMESSPQPVAESSSATGLAIAGLVLLMVTVAGAIVIERRRRPPPGANPSGTATD